MTAPHRLLVAASACLAGMLVIAAAVTGLGEPEFDATIDSRAADLRDTWFADVLRVLTDLGYLPWYPILVGVVVAALAIAGQRQMVVPLVGAVLLAWGGFVGFKAVFRRTRPEFGEYIAGGWSMPSGHSALAFALGTSLLLAMPARHRRWAAVPLLAYALLTGMSRIVLGVHYSTDVVAGALLGAGCAFASFGIVGLVRARRAHRPAG